MNRVRYASNQVVASSAAKTPERTVLVVDDDNVSIIYVAAVLERDGYSVQVAHDAAEGLALLARQQVGVVISDYRMPDIDGILFLERVRWDYPQTVRIMLSGDSNLDILDNSINRSAIYQFLAKPVAADTLCSTVQQAFQWRQTGLFPSD